MALDYNTYVSQIANLTVISSNDVNFQTMLPGMIDYAEQRIYREGDFLATYVSAATNLSSASGAITYPTATGTFLVIDQIYVSTSTSTSAVSGTPFHPLTVVSLPYIITVYGTSNSYGFPKFFSPLNAIAAQISPAPDQAYLAVVYGTQRPTPLSSANSSTYLTQSLPDLFIAASMIFASGYMRNFGSQADDAAMAVSWSKQYDILFASAGMEEQRKKYGSQGWQSQIPNPIATPPRV